MHGPLFTDATGDAFRVVLFTPHAVNGRIRSRWLLITQGMNNARFLHEKLPVSAGSFFSIVAVALLVLAACLISGEGSAHDVDGGSIRLGGKLRQLQ